MGISVLASMGSNRTFMELKWWWRRQRKHVVLCSNRTFMELKLATQFIVKMKY